MSAANLLRNLLKKMPKKAPKVKEVDLADEVAEKTTSAANKADTEHAEKIKSIKEKTDAANERAGELSARNYARKKRTEEKIKEDNKRSEQEVKEFRKRLGLPERSGEKKRSKE